MKRLLREIGNRISSWFNSTDMGYYESNLYAVGNISKQELSEALAFASERASKQPSYASAVAVGSGGTAGVKEESRFKKHKLDCDNCGGPLAVGTNNIASCSFCNSQYYLEGFKKQYIDDWEYDYKNEPSGPYWVDGGVSSTVCQEDVANGYKKWNDLR